MFKFELCNDALHFSIFISLKLRGKPKISPSFQNLMEEDYGVILELICLVSNIKMEVCNVLNCFCSF
jgi:hypothetical protein